MADKKSNLTPEQIDQITVNTLGSEIEENQKETSSLTPEDIEEIKRDVKLEKKFGDRPGAAGALGFLDTASFGIAKQALVKSGLSTPEEIKELEDRNKAASITGQVGGIVLPGALSGGSTLLARSAAITGKGISGVSKAGQITEQVTAKALNKIIKDTGNKKLAKSIVQKSIPKVAGSAVEGSFYGAGDLISENAIGNAELNAENILGSLGAGAVFGGVAGSVFGPMESLLVPVGRGVKGIGKRAQRFLNKEDAALDLVGATSAARNKLKQNAPDVVKLSPDYLVRKGKLGIFTDTDNLQANITKEIAKDGKKIGRILNQLDEIAKTNPVILPSNRDVYQRIINRLDDDIINKFKDAPGFTTKLRSVRSIRRDFSKKINDLKVKATDLQQLRQRMKDLAGLEKEVGKRTLGEQAAFNALASLRNEIDNIALRGEKFNTGNQFGNLFKELKEANLDFRIGSTLEKFVTKKANKQNVINNLDLLVGGSGLIFEQPELLGLVGIKKLVNSDLRRRLSVLVSMEKANLAATKKITNSVGNFFKGIKKAAVPLSTKILLDTNFGKKFKEGKKPEKPKNKKEAFKNVSENINRVKSDPQILIEEITQNTARINNGAPETASFIEPKVVEAINFIDQKIPRDASPGSALSAFTREFEPSSLDLAKFERYMQAIENPLSVLDELESGTLTREHVEALKVVYPKLYTQIQEAVMEKVVDESNQIDYNRRVQLGILLDIPTDSSLNPEFISRLQSNFAPAQGDADQEIRTTPKSLRELDSQDEAGGSESFLRRRREA